MWCVEMQLGFFFVSNQKCNSNYFGNAEILLKCGCYLGQLKEPHHLLRSAIFVFSFLLSWNQCRSAVFGAWKWKPLKETTVFCGHMAKRKSNLSNAIFLRIYFFGAHLHSSVTKIVSFVWLLFIIYDLFTHATNTRSRFNDARVQSQDKIAFIQFKHRLFAVHFFILSFFLRVFLFIYCLRVLFFNDFGFRIPVYLCICRLANNFAIFYLMSL